MEPCVLSCVCFCTPSGCGACPGTACSDKPLTCWGLPRSRVEAPWWFPSFEDTQEFISWGLQGVQRQGGRSPGLVLLMGQNQPPAA